MDDPSHSVSESDMRNIFSLCCYGEVESLQNLLASTHASGGRAAVTALVNSADQYGLRPLHEACKEGHNNIVLALLKQQADPNLTDLVGQTALHLAAGGGHVGTVRLLLEKGAAVSVNVRDHKGRTALHWANMNSVSRE